MFRRRSAVAAVWLAVLSFVPSILVAQDATGTLSGVVRDSTGAALPGATIKLVNDASAASLETVSDGEGGYRLTALVPGSYRVEAVLDGFDVAVKQVVVAAAQPASVDLALTPSRLQESVVVTARRVEEVAQEVPIPLSVVTGNTVADAGAFNVNRLKEMLPTVQFYSTNPRNSAINIRGLGAPFGLTNDGIEPGVGLYIDGVFYARPAAATLDFLDVERIEVLRGPQGTLFGKNTTAGAINVTTKKPSFSRDGEFELNYGDLDFVQAKASISGPLSEKVAARASFSGTRRGGTVYNTRTGHDVNNLNNQGLRGQILFAPSDRLAITASTDFTRQRPEGYTQVIAGVAPTLRAANRQFPQIAADFGYVAPSDNPFERLTDVDSSLASNQDMGGAAVVVDWTVGRGRLNSTTSWRFWSWDPSNDRDFIGLPVTSVSAAPSTQGQWTQELRYAGDITPRLNFVTGAFAFRQQLDSDPSFKQEQGSAAARFLLAPTPAALTPGLLDGYGFNQDLNYHNLSAALFGQLEWSVNDRLRLLPGLRFNYDQKDVDFNQTVYGGLQTTDPVLVALKLSVLAPQAYTADVSDNNLSGQFTAAYRISSAINTYATYATSFKSVGLNLNGVPTDARDRPVLSAATVKPEDVHHVEFGVKSEPFSGVTANVTAFDTEIKDFQAQVVNAGVGVLRGYLANAEKVRVRGFEFDGAGRPSRDLSIYGALAYTDGVYVSFKDAPPPFEETGGPQVKDISGSALPGISKWAMSIGSEFARPATVMHQAGHVFVAADASYRSSFSSSASASKYLVVDGYVLVNPRVGFRSASGWTLSFWARNAFNEEYFELMSAQPGNTGLYMGQVGDQRTVGVTLRVSLRAK